MKWCPLAKCLCRFNRVHHLYISIKYYKVKGKHLPYSITPTSKCKKMKTIKSAITLLILILISTVSVAQEYKIQVENSKLGKLILNGFSGDLPWKVIMVTKLLLPAHRKDLPKSPSGLKDLKLYILQEPTIQVLVLKWKRTETRLPFNVCCHLRIVKNIK